MSMFFKSDRLEVCLKCSFKTNSTYDLFLRMKSGKTLWSLYGINSYFSFETLEFIRNFYFTLNVDGHFVKSSSY